MVALNMGTFVICLALAFLAGVVVKLLYRENKGVQYVDKKRNYSNR